MPTITTTEHNIVRNRRGDPDPTVSVGEAFTPYGTYEHTYLQIGPVRLKFYQERAWAKRICENLLGELQKKLKEFGKSQ